MTHVQTTMFRKATFAMLLVSLVDTRQLFEFEANLCRAEFIQRWVKKQKEEAGGPHYPLKLEMGIQITKSLSHMLALRETRLLPILQATIQNCLLLKFRVTHQFKGRLIHYWLDLSHV